jgi:TonB family protein
MFGGRLSIDSASTQDEVASSGSKKGLFVGLAAAAVLVVAGAAWYTKQPGNSPTASSAPKQAVTQPANFDPAPAPETAAKPISTSSAPMTKSAPVPIAAAQPSNFAPSSSTAPAPVAAKNSNASTHSAPPVEEPKKPTLGDVRLATPVVNHVSGSQDASEGEPAVVDSQVPTNVDSLGGLAAGNSKGPVAPAPIGGDVKQAQLIKSVPPAYPSIARSQRISGNVQIDALIDAQGNVTTMKVLSGPPMLHQAAVEALKQWKYSPALLDGKPTSMHLTVTIQFRAQ